MEIAQYLMDEAERVLKYEGDKSLPKALSKTEFFLAKKDDESIFAFGVIKFNDNEYKIGPKKNR